MSLSLSLYGCGGDKEKASESSESGQASNDPGAPGDERDWDEPEEIDEVEDPETPSFSEEDSDELREEKHGNGQNKAKGYMRRDQSDNYVRVGPWKHWYRNGNVKESGSYSEEGKKIGRWESWYKNGQKESERHFKDDLEHGKFTLWKKKGQLREKGSHVEGKKHGTWKRWFKSKPQQEYEQNYNKGAKTGRWIAWRKSGDKKEETHYKFDVKHGMSGTWFKKGQMESKGAYKRGDKEGKWTTWHKNGQKKMEATFDLGERVAGTISEWTSKGKVRDPERVRVYLYGRDNCKWTRKALKRVKDSGIKYVYRRTDKSQRNWDKYRKLGDKHRCNSVPLALIDGKAICGFSEKEYRRRLK